MDVGGRLLCAGLNLLLLSNPLRIGPFLDEVSVMAGKFLGNLLELRFKREDGGTDVESAGCFTESRSRNNTKTCLFKEGESVEFIWGLVLLGCFFDGAGSNDDVGEGIHG